MSKLKNAFFHTIMYQAEIEEATDGETVPLDLAREMLDTIDRLEYELALYHAGCEKDEVDRMMKKTYRPFDKRIA